MKNQFISGIKLTIITLALFGFAYPLLITGLGLLVAPEQGEGVTVIRDGQVVGFEHIGQSFESPRYFHGRPSAVKYNAASAGGSNKGPANEVYLKEVALRLDMFLMENPGVTKDQVPMDAITASGSGLDPHISVRSAACQVARIARARGVPEKAIRELIESHTEAPLLQLAGPAKINVLKINVALDQIK